MRAKLLAAVVLVVPAVATVPLEQRLHAERLRLKYGGAPLTRAVRASVGQGMAIALLAGFRGIVADFVWIQSQGFWERKEWLRQYRNMELATLLQPQSVLFWDLAQWHMAWNIGHAVRTDPANRSAAEGIKREREWQERAREVLARGIENVPNRYDLYFTMGWLYWQKFSQWQPDGYCRAAEYLGTAAAFPTAPSYVGRLYARALEKCGRRADAYEYWKALWADRGRPHQLWTVVEREIKRLEDELDIPAAQRIFPATRTP